MSEDTRKKNIIELTRISLGEYRAKKKLPMAVMCDSVRSMMNVGSIFRTADAFMIEEMVLAGISGRPPHPEISKTALGADESVKWRHAGDAFAEVRKMQAEGWKICVLEQTHNSIPLQKFCVEEGDKYLLVVGNEVEGVSQKIVDIADYVLEIPQYGTKHSLNVAVSTAIALWHLQQQLIGL